jgi:hypothetical protein
MFSPEAQVRVDYVATIANPASPDASSELNTTTPLTSWIPAGALEPDSTNNTVSTASLLSSYNTSVPGTQGGPITFKFKKHETPASDTAWNLFKTGPSGNIVIRYGQGGGTGAWTAGDKVMVYPGKATKALMDPSPTNTEQTFSVVWHPSVEPSLDATVQA